MGIFSNEIDRSLLKQGDHIYCYRNGHLYSHHGIYIGGNRVIHFTRTQDDGQKDIIPGSWKLSSSQSTSNRYSCKDDDCVNNKNKYNPKKALGVVKCCLDCFLQGHRLFRFKYATSVLQAIINDPGTCTTKPANYGPEEAVQRAMEMLKEPIGFGEYDLFNNNCESFAAYCKTGKRVSTQVLVWKKSQFIV